MKNTINVPQFFFEKVRTKKITETSKLQWTQKLMSKILEKIQATLTRLTGQSPVFQSL